MSILIFVKGSIKGILRTFIKESRKSHNFQSDSKSKTGINDIKTMKGVVVRVKKIKNFKKTK